MLSELSRELGINPKTVAKGRKPALVEDQKTGPMKLRSTVVTEGEKAFVVASRIIADRHLIGVCGDEPVQRQRFESYS